MGSLSLREQSVSTAEVHESHTQIRGAWRHFASSSSSGEIIDTPEAFIAASNVTWPMLNVAFLPGPAQTEGALERASAAAARYFAPRKRGWMFFLSEDWVTPEARPRLPELFGAHGLKLVSGAMGMVAERLLPPTRALPPLEVRRVDDDEGRQHMADINALGYDTPLALGREALAWPTLYQGDCRGYVGYVEGKAATVTAILRQDGIAYVALVATLPEHRRHGYAEALIRHGLAEAKRDWGLERTVLHATEVGHPLYRRMGYRDVTRFSFYLALGH
jgi:ribosomal protein S18 acetylase RimI-like enzyme